MIYPMNLVSPVNNAYIINPNPNIAGIANIHDLEHNANRDANIKRNIPIPPNFILDFGFSILFSTNIISQTAKEL